MKTDLITINNQGMGFPAALRECRKAAEYRKLDKKPALQLELLTEELLSMARSVTGDMKGTFWIESEGMRFDLHLSTQTIMDREKREQLLNLRARILQAEEDRLRGARTMSVSEAREALRKL